MMSCPPHGSPPGKRDGERQGEGEEEGRPVAVPGTWNSSPGEALHSGALTLKKNTKKKHRRGCETSVRTMPVSPLSLSVHPAVCLSLCSHFSQVSSPLSAQHTHTEKRQRQTDRKRDRRKKELFFWEWERGCCNLTVPFVNSSMEQPG